MMGLGALGFTAPWLLLGLFLLPLIWILLRAMPPAPTRRIFPAVTLLLGMKDDEAITDRTPWWLLVIRLLAAALLILGFSGPVLRNTVDDRAMATPSDRLLIVADHSWAGAPYWSTHQERLAALRDIALSNGQQIAILELSAPAPVTFMPPILFDAIRDEANPRPWHVQDPDAILEHLPQGDFDTVWLSDGLSFDGHGALYERLAERGNVEVYPGDMVLAIGDVTRESGATLVELHRSRSGQAATIKVNAQGRDPSGNPALLAQTEVRFEPDALSAVARFELPGELLARLTQFEMEGHPSAGAIWPSGSGLRIKEVALITGTRRDETQDLLSPLHYLVNALAPQAELIVADLPQVLPANPDAIILAGIGTLPAQETAALIKWVEAGGILLRFATPELGQSASNQTATDPLLPVRLRAGGRDVGGALSWETPQTLAPFRANTPFFGLPIPGDVAVTAQLVAEPGPELAQSSIAELEDGTPLVTRKTLGQGQTILFHVPANASWSTLPLSELFVQMLSRLISLSGPDLDPASNIGTRSWALQSAQDGFGRLLPITEPVEIDGQQLLNAPSGPDVLPGIYVSGTQSYVKSAFDAEAGLTAASWPQNATFVSDNLAPPLRLSGPFLAMGVSLILIDIIAALALTGRLTGFGRSQLSGAIGIMVLTAALAIPDLARAQEQSSAAQMASEFVLGHVITGDQRVDEIARAGMMGLSNTLSFRTSVEPNAPRGVDLERDELALYPLLYWPIAESQAQPSQEAYAKLNAYLRSGGMILFDTRDGDLAALGTRATAQARKLRDLTQGLDIPALEPVAEDHILTRSFYLLQNFPGRFVDGRVWVEAIPEQRERIAGAPFRNPNDGVSPVVIGSNDWASAWAVDRNGRALFPVGAGLSGERQRELANRFGVNLVMYVLTGNYKSDQVHIPALLDRLGQ